jgi:hypothetical protein
MIMKKLLFIAILFIVTLVSCQKDFNATPDTPIKSTKDLKVSSTFDWKTSKEITLNIIGMKDINPEISNVLYVRSSIGDTTYYKDLLYMNSNYTIKFAVPTTETKVILIYGSKIVTIDLITNAITYDYITQ